MEKLFGDKKKQHPTYQQTQEWLLTYTNILAIRYKNRKEIYQ